jgi:hypothetical protein
MSTSNNAAALVSLVLGLLGRASAAGALLTKTRAEDRQPTDEEMKAFYDADDQARANLQAAIDQAKAPEVMLAKGPFGNL